MHNLSVPTIGSVRGKFWEAIPCLFTAEIEALFIAIPEFEGLHDDTGIAICSYKMYTTKVIHGKQGLRS